MDRNHPDCSSIVVTVLILLLLGGISIGPKGCDRHLQSWVSSSYGADWLVIQYTGQGQIQNYWELKSKSIGNEGNSDGIFFVAEDGNMVHLSGHYLYLQVPEPNWASVKAKYLGIK